MKKSSHLALAAIAVVAAMALAGTASANTTPGLSALGYPEQVHFEGAEFRLGSQLSCDAPDLSATLEGPTFGLTAPASETSECSWGGIENLDMNGCEFIFHGSSADIGPPGCGPIRTSFAGPCFLDAQTGFNVKYTGAATSLPGLQLTEEVEVTGKASLTPINGYCGEPELVARWTIDEGVLYTGDYAFDGLALTREAAPQLDALAFPVQPVAFNYDTIAPFDELSGFDMGVECQNYFDQGSQVAKQEAAALSFAGAYSGSPAHPDGESCSSTIGDGQVSMNSCRYELGELEWLSEGDFAAPEAGIGCEESGDAIEFTIPISSHSCVVKLPAQALQASVYSDELGGSAGLIVHLDSEALKYTASFVCQLAGTKKSGEDGVMHQTLAVTGALAP